MVTPESSPPTSQVPSDHEERDDAIIGKALLWSALVIGAVVVTIASLVFWLTRPDEKVVEGTTEVTLPDVRDGPQREVPKSPFVDVTDESGITFQHENGATGEKLLPETMGGGCAVLDYDSDGDQDLLFVNSTYWPWDARPAGESPTTRLYRNNGGFRFEDVSEESGLDVVCYGMGAAVADYDADGDPDVYLTAVGRNRLFRNDGGTFVEVTEEAGVAGGEDEWSTGAGFFDYNGDGRLDLFVCNYVQWSRELDLGQDFRLVGVGRAYGPPTAFQGAYPRLFRNDGGTFTDVSEETNIRVRNPATGIPVSKALGVVFTDLDQDGWMDVVVANDTVPNLLFHNQQGDGFIEIGALSGVAFDVNGHARGAMGIDTSRFYETDDALAIAIGNFANEMTALYVALGDDPMAFIDAATATGLGPATRQQLTFGLFFFDYDLDGRLDLLGANGHLEEEINKVQSNQHYEQPPQLFWNAGEDQATQFEPVPVELCGEDFVRPMVGRGATYADFDGDGDLDVVITSVGGPPRVLRNDQELGHHWVRFRLVGAGSNRDAIGAEVELVAGGKLQRRQVTPTKSYLSQAELPVTFGLGEAEELTQLRIVWPDGTTREWTGEEASGLEIDREHVISQETPSGISRVSGIVP